MKLRKEPKFEDIDLYDFEQANYGYWIGQTTILGLLFHVEVLELEKKPGTWRTINASYQHRLDDWFERNGEERPNIRVDTKGRRFFVCAEVYAV